MSSRLCKGIFKTIKVLFSFIFAVKALKINFYVTLTLRKIKVIFKIISVICLILKFDKHLLLRDGGGLRSIEKTSTGGGDKGRNKFY